MSPLKKISLCSQVNEKLCLMCGKTILCEFIKLQEKKIFLFKDTEEGQIYLSMVT